MTIGTVALPCRCDEPRLSCDESNDIRCFMCGRSPREDLGGDDDRARLRYRVALNRMRATRPPRHKKPRKRRSARQSRPSRSGGGRT